MDEEAPPMVLEDGSKAYRIVNRTVKRKLLEMFPDYGTDDPDNVLCEYIQVMLCNRKQKSQVVSDLTPFLEDGAARFTQWLWDYLRFLADSFEERPRLSAGRSKSAARDIDLIHDKRKREVDAEEDYCPQHSRRAPSSSRRSTARDLDTVIQHERRPQLTSPQVIDCDDEDDINGGSGPKRRGRRHVSGHMNGSTTQATVAYAIAPASYQPSGVQVVQYVPANGLAAPMAATPTLIGLDGTVMTAASAAVAAPFAFGPAGGAPAPPRRRHDDRFSSDHNPVSVSPRAAAPARGQPNMRPTWLANPPDAEEDPSCDQPPVRFMVTFRGTQQHPTSHREEETAAFPAPPHADSSSGRGRDRLPLRDPLRYGEAEAPLTNGKQKATPAAPLQYGVGRRASAETPNVTVTFGGTPRAMPAALLHYSSSPVPSLQPTMYVGPAPIMPALGAGVSPFMLDNFIPANNTLSSLAAVGAQRVIASCPDRSHTVPAFKRLRPDSSSLVIDFDDDGEDGSDSDGHQPQDWASQNVDVMGNSGFGQEERRPWQRRGQQDRGSPW